MLSNNVYKLPESIQGDYFILSRGIPLIDQFFVRINQLLIIDTNLCQLINLPELVFFEKIVIFRTNNLHMSWKGKAGNISLDCNKNFYFAIDTAMNFVYAKIFSNVLLSLLDYNFIKFIEKESIYVRYNG